MSALRYRALLACVMLSLLPLPVRGDQAQAPLWELGLGAGVISFPDYPGSSRQSTWLLPLPYLVYRGDWLQADRDGLRARLLDSERLELHLGLSANPPTDQDEDGVRQDMPALDPGFEAGPELRWRITGDAGALQRIELRLPLRFAFVIDGTQIESTGATFSPALHYSARELPCRGCNLGVGVGPVFGDADIHDYYYGVAPRYETSDRPRFAADAGYGGMQLTANLSRRTGNVWIGGFLRLRSVRGASFDDSPLVEQDNGVYAGFGIAYVFASSSRLVTLRDTD